MTARRLLKILLLFILLPFISFIMASGLYLFITLKQNALDAIEETNRIYKIALVNDARYALSTGNASAFQQNIERLVNESGGRLLSIELINDAKQILASAPEYPDLNAPVIRVPVMVATSGNDLLDLPVWATKDTEAGYIEIRYNNNLPADAVSHFVWLFGLLFTAFLLVISITVVILRRMIFAPINRITTRIEDLINGNDPKEVELVDDFLSPIDHVLNVLARKEIVSNNKNNSLTQQLIVSRNNVDVANVTKVMLIHDLIERMDKPLSNAREVMVSVSNNNRDDRVKDGLKLISAYLNDTYKTIRESRIIMEQIGRETEYTTLTIQDFYDGLFDFIKTDGKEVVPALLCNEKYVDTEISIDSMHIYQLVAKIFKLSSITSRTGTEIYLTVRVEYRSQQSMTISIDIKDMGPGFPMETVHNFNQFMTNENIKLHIPGFPPNDLQMIRFLSSRGGIHVSVSTEYGRGNNYRITIDKEELPYNRVNGFTQNKLNGAILHNGIINSQLNEHFRSIGIDLVNILQFDAPSHFPEIFEMDFVIVEFVDNIETTLNLCRALLSRKRDLNIIPAYQEQSPLCTQLKDRLFDLQIKGKHISMPYGASTIIDALRGDKEPDDVIARLLESFTKKSH